MSLLSELLKESASAGATSAGGVANDRGTLFGGGNGGSTIMLRRMGFVEVGDLPNKKKKKQLFKSLREADSSAVAVKPFDYQDTLSKLDQAVKTASERKEDVAVFGLEDDEGKIVKVYVDKDQASKFEDALAIMLADNDTIFSDEDEPKTEQEIAEILYKLKDQFNIRDVEWGGIDDVEIDGDDGAEDFSDIDAIDELPPEENEEVSSDKEEDQPEITKEQLAKLLARKEEKDAAREQADAKNTDAADPLKPLKDKRAQQAKALAATDKMIAARSQAEQQ